MPLDSYVYLEQIAQNPTHPHQHTYIYTLTFTTHAQYFFYKHSKQIENTHILFILSNDNNCQASKLKDHLSEIFIVQVFFSSKIFIPIAGMVLQLN